MDLKMSQGDEPQGMSLPWLMNFKLL